MPEIIACPRCQRKLRLEESIIGQTVQCPSCEHSFTAETPTRAAPPPPRPVDDEPTYRPVDDDPPPRRYEDARPRRRNDDDDEDYPRSRRRRFDDSLRPHRGSTILTLGILSLCMFFCMPGIVLAIVTLVLSLGDLGAMNRREMDETGRGQTKAGMICALIALVFTGLLVFSCVGMNVLNDM